MFNMAVHYQTSMLGKEPSCMDRAQSMRHYSVLQSVVIGLTAFLSMLSKDRKQKERSTMNIEQTIKNDLNIRNKLSYAHKISFDLYVLCQSYPLGNV